MSPLKTYLTDIAATHAHGRGRELSYRAPLQTLLGALLPAVAFTHEGERLAGVGAPDFLAYASLHGASRLIGCIETKDLDDQDLHGRHHNQPQFNRYKANIPNCVFTNYLRFVFFLQHEPQPQEIAIAELNPKTNQIAPLPQNHPRFIALLESAFIGQEFRIDGADQLAAAMANRAALLRDAIAAALQNPATPAGAAFADYMQEFKNQLLQDITADQFADLVAQTTAYGFLIARVKCPPGAPFSRQMASDLIPASIGFLRGFFNLIAGNDIIHDIKWIVDSMADIFAAADIQKIMRRHGAQTGAQDPVFHFYESFLGKYAPQERAKRGVWYTPEPVVNFIVRAVHHLLQERLGIRNGLANTDTVSVAIAPAKKDGKDGKDGPRAAPQRQTFHKVQILDPAAGTGAFLAEVIRQIHAGVQQGGWSDYVETDLLPRINGFEILMAPYAMAHLQLGELLKSLGYAPRQNPQPRHQVFLTDALQRQEADGGSLLARWLAAEAKAADKIKRHAPVMCVLGNPPYNVESANTGDWIMGLMESYKQEPGGKQRLQEKKFGAINDDYVKFIRYAQHFIEKGGRGIVAFINPHGFLDNRTFRGMRWQLLRAYDLIYTIDLHGNARKKETAPDGGKDDNVFNIMQGVSINLLVKTGEKPDGELARVFHHDLYGARQHKYDFLRDNTLATVPFAEVQPQAPRFEMVPRDYELQREYERGIPLDHLFEKKSVGIMTARDGFTIQRTRKQMQQTIARFLQLADEEARQEFALGKDTQGWAIKTARADLQKHYPDKGALCPILLRPFDCRWTFYTGNSTGFHSRPITDIMRHIIAGENIGLLFVKGIAADAPPVMVTTHIINNGCFRNPGMVGRDYCAPLYLYAANNGQGDLAAPAAARRPNLNMTIVGQIADLIGLQFSEQESDTTLTPHNILDYIYAALHSPAYRRKYAQFLKTDFPRIPLPANAGEFRRLAKIGQQLRQTHLLQHPAVQNSPVTYPIDGDGIVRAIQHKQDRVYINATQYFAGVPAAAWTAQIGGYHPAQKFLKDRKNRPLAHTDADRYRHLIAALLHTLALTNQIDP